MGIVKANEPLAQKPVIMVYYGDPGICKTSLFNTSDHPLLIDADRGVQRSILRKDTLVVNTWDEVLAEEAAGTFKNYKTIGIDTAKALLDDFLMNWVVKQDYKMATNKLKAYGELGDNFKVFINNRRADSADIVIIAHAKKDEDTKKFIPDVTGQSFSLIMRIADQVGFITMENGKRIIKFEPTDMTVGKNVACIATTEIPDKNDPSFRNFNARLIERVRVSISRMSEEQQAAMETTTKFQDLIAGAQTPEALTKLIDEIKTLEDFLKVPLKKVMTDRAKEAGWIWDKDQSKYIVPVAVAAPAAETPTPGETEQPEAPEPPANVDEAPAPPDNLITGDPSTLDEIMQKAEMLETAYETEDDFIKALGECSDVEEVGTLYFNNSELVERTPKLKSMVDNAVNVFFPPQTQTLAWFSARIGKRIYCQGSNSKQFTGPFEIKSQLHADHLATTAQEKEGFLFRDLPETSGVSEQPAAPGEPKKKTPTRGGTKNAK